MEELKNKAEELTDSVKEYIQTYYKLSLFKVTEKATSIASAVLAGFLVFFLGLFILLFSGIALGIWFGDLLNNKALGYLMVSFLFLIILIVILLLRKRIIFPKIRNLIIRKLYE